ncbi:LppP/LprE family lipoprotein [Rhodococcus kronopolitis]|uniref:LppP/LprE family lipoprotein n=1 Tax=Rhodococcus kronopolitis TaxID=1460226 RepID=A0ABV9FNM6_9NOCA
MRTPTVTVTVCAALIAVAVTACGNDTEPPPPAPAAARPSETRATESVPSTTQSTPATEDAGDTVSGQGRCLDPDSVGVRDAVAGLDQTPYGWVVGAASEDPLGSCPDLSWAVADVQAGTASSPRHVLFFHDGRYLGTATAEPYAFTHVAGTTGSTVTVEYRWLADNEPNCCPAGGPAAIDYTWDGSRVVMEQSLPQAMLDSYHR